MISTNIGRSRDVSGHVPGTRANKNMRSLLLGRWHSRTGRAKTALESPACLPVTGPLPRAHKTEADLQGNLPCWPLQADRGRLGSRCQAPACASRSFPRVGLARGLRAAWQSGQGPVGLPPPGSLCNAVLWPFLGTGPERGFQEARPGSFEAEGVLGRPPLLSVPGPRHLPLQGRPAHRRRLRCPSGGSQKEERSLPFQSVPKFQGSKASWDPQDDK